MKINGIIKSLPCGKCVNCKKGKAYDWSERIKNHIAYNPECFFVTLTYEDPIDENANAYKWSLSKRDAQLFFKRLRKFYKNKKISYFLCGEYGEKTGRPHYHALIFGLAMKDLNLEKKYNHLYSETLRHIWPYGNNEIGNIEPNSIYYVTGYILKNKYNHHLMDNRQPEFNLMSKNLGLDMFLEKFDYYVEKFNKRESIPTYYWRLLNEISDHKTTIGFIDSDKIKAMKIASKRGKLTNDSYRRALRDITNSNFQKETDYQTLKKLTRSDKL